MSACGFDRISRPLHREVATRQNQMDSHSSRDRADSPGRPKWLEFTEQNTNEERSTQEKNSGNLQRVPMKYLEEYVQRTCVCVLVCARKPLSWGKTTHRLP